MTAVDAACAAPDAAASAQSTTTPPAVAHTGLQLPMLAGLMAHAGAILFARGRDGRYLLANEAFAELVGKPVDAIVGRTGAELFPPEIAAEHTAHDSLILADGRTRLVHEYAPDKNGRLHAYTSNKFALLGPDGRPFAVGGFCQDVTDALAERTSRLDAEARFRVVFDHAPIGQVFSGLDGVLETVNEPMAQMLGYEPHEMVGRPTTEFVRVPEMERISVTARLLAGGDMLSTSAIRRFVHRDGHEIPVRVTSAAVPGEDGAPQWFVSLVADITDEERTQAELARAHATAVLTTDRLRLMHAVAAAANEATTVDALAPRMFGLVLAHTRWPGAALVEWPTDDEEVRVLATRGSLRGELTAADIDFAAPRTGRITVQELAGVPVAVVPMRDERSAQCYAWLFVLPALGLPDEYREVLTLLGLESTRVIEREAAARQLRDGEGRFRAVFESSPLPMGLTLGDSGTYAVVNDALCQLLGRTPDQLIGRSARDIVHPDDHHLTDPAGAAALAAPDGRHTVELRLVHSSGRVIDAMVSLAWMEGPDGSRQLLAHLNDITDTRLVAEIQRRQAEEDPLTGLANRAQLGRVLTEYGRDGAVCAALFIDLDGFKMINDTRGHDVGDEVLVAVAERLLSAVRTEDLVARFGGDEFVVICALDHGDEVGQVADRIESALAAPIVTRSGPATVTVSVGVASGVVDPIRPQQLVQRADAAMYQAKRRGKDRREIYTAELHARTVAQRQTEGALRGALEEGRFAVHYQPVVDLANEHVLGFEALVRLVDESGKLVPPAMFIGVAEASGLIVPMGNWVLNESCRTIARLRAETGLPLTVAVNIAARQAARPEFADNVAAAIADSGLPEQALAIELTESALLEADGSTLRQLTRLRDSGVVVALDDFGTGYSSLSYLRSFPVSHLKVDRSFVSGLTTVTSDLAIVRSVTRLAEDLGLQWVAEGVETTDQRDALRRLGRGMGQGYLFSRPIAADGLPRLLRRLNPAA